MLAKKTTGDPRLAVWPAAAKASDPNAYHHVCNICGWHGAAFAAPPHSEMANCPNCGSIARDRFSTGAGRVGCRTVGAAGVGDQPAARSQYRNSVMSRIVNYTTSDYDESAHKR
jgi:hypothetical protein